MADSPIGPYLPGMNLGLPDLNMRRSNRDASKRFFRLSPRLNIETFLTISGNANNGNSQSDICRQSNNFPISNVSNGVYCNCFGLILNYDDKDSCSPNPNSELRLREL